MGILPFHLAAGRVLIIAPNVEIRDGVARELNYTNAESFWQKADVLTDFSNGPHLAVLDGRDANIHDCREAHIVVANIQQLASSADRWLPQFPDNFFDLILIDEGHHNVAPSWQRVVERFPNAKVVSLTATPFRSDGNEVLGESIYRYPFARAMNRGYIKRLQAVNVAPSEIYFTYLNDEHRHTLEEVLALREEDWFRKGVSLSRETNISIVDASIQCLRRLRTTGTRHQIIAAACTINHARDIAALYRERNYQAEAIDSRMRPDERVAVLRDLRNGTLDAIIQVGILGEGFDHPPLSVAAIFRPYRSLSPYVQFVGRIMRVLRQNAPLDLDNEGFVVSHIGLQQDERWQDFRRFDREDQLLFADLIGGDEGIPPERAQPEGRVRVRPDMIVLDQLVERFITDTFLDPTDEGALDELMQQIPQLLGVQPEEIGLTREDLAARILAARRRAELTPERIPVQPQQQRQQRRRRLDEETRSVAGRIIQAFNLAPQGRDLARLFPRLGMNNNLAVAIRMMHAEVNQTMGFTADTRAELTNEQLEHAIQQMSDIAGRIQSRIRQAMEQGR
jgi:DNA repair protein RadD